MTGPMVMLAQAAKMAKKHVSNVGTPVTLHWVERVGGTLDKVTGAHSGQVVKQAKTVRAFVHFVSAKSMLIKFAELKTGDALLDFAADLELTGKEELRFEIQGEFWTQKKVSDQLIRTWDALMGTEKLFQTIAVETAA